LKPIEISQRRADLSPSQRALLERRLRGAGTAPTPARNIPRRPAGREVPLSFAQERLWFLDQLVPENSILNCTDSLRFSFSLEADFLERSLNEIVRRHESLRTTFQVIEGQPVQVIAPQLVVPLPVTDLRRLDRADAEAAAAGIVADAAGRPFDLAHGPLLRADLLQLQEDEYIFLLTMHHIIADGWSMEVFWDELEQLWAAYAEGRPSPLPDLPIQYADFALWQRGVLRGRVIEEHIGYWRNQLAGVTTLQLPLDRLRPPVQTFCGSEYAFLISSSVARGLKSLSQREGATLFMTLLGAFQVLLFRYTEQEDVVVGTYVAGRNRVDIEKLIGFFVNALVLRADLSGNPSFREFLSRVREMALGAYAHQEMPFERLVQELQPERDLSRNPFFQAVFQLVNVPTRGGQEPVPGVSVMQVERSASALDLTCTLWEDENQLKGRFEFNTDLFDESTIARMSSHFQNLLEDIVANAEKRISELNLLSGGERQQLLTDWNSTQRPYDFDHSLLDDFEEQVKRQPDAPAFFCNGLQLTYEQLDQRSNQLARCLKTLGVGPELLVGVCLERSLELPVVLLAVFKSGGAYLPLDPAYPSQWLNFILEDAGAPVLITESKYVERLKTKIEKTILLDAARAEIAAQDSASLHSPVSPDSLAYCIYTSGSTGQPKGVAVEHRQIINRLRWMKEAYPLVEGEMMCQRTALNFVDSLWELLGPLLEGIPTLVLADESIKSLSGMVGELADFGVTRIWVVPSLLKALLDRFPDLQQRLPRLRFWVSSGEPLSEELFDQFSAEMPASLLYNLYGTSEVWDATWYDPVLELQPEHNIPIGRPIANVQAYVLDPNLNSVPIGVPGELCIGGLGVARGYLNRPELTEAKFIPNPFSSSGNLYRTGDRARYLADGNIEHLGRSDHQVKLRGYRIELGDVSSVLCQHEGVSSAIVLLGESVAGDAQLVAYVVPRQDVGVQISALRSFLRDRLPQHMVPAAFVMLDELPLKPNGKIDRAALPAAGRRERDAGNGALPPRTPTEKSLARIWENLLGWDQVGMNDNFFNDLGGHSLIAARVVSLVQNTLQVEIPLRAIFENPTINDLAAVVDAAVQSGKRVPVASIMSVPRKANQWSGLQTS
jgi:amino acid adenylation domain-containing protein